MPMQWMSRGAALPILLALAIRPAAVGAQDAATALVDVTVVPMDRERLLPHQTVVVSGGKVTALGPVGDVAVPAGARRIEGAGKFLIPGLAEMHAHIPPGQATDAEIERTLALYALHGVTTVRGMLGAPRHLAYRERAARGEILSPRIWTTGPSLNGNSVPTVAAAIAAVTEQKAAGYDLLKIHPGIQRTVFDSLAATAHRLGMPFAGHVPLDVGLVRAIEARYASIDHIDGFVEALVRDGAPVSGTQSQWFGVNLARYADLSKLPPLVEATRAAGIWVVPTQSLFESGNAGVPIDSLRARPEMVYVSPALEAAWVRQTEGIRSQGTPEDHQALLALRRQILKALADGGVPFLLGSDAPQIWNVPGYSIRWELEAIVAAGLTPYQALASGTRNVAVYLGNEKEAGTVAVGKRADLVLLEANPLQDVRAVRRQAGVMVGGVWYAPNEVAARLAALRAR